MNEKNQFVIKLSSTVIFCLIMFAVLFDRDGSAVGLDFISLPSYLMVLASGIGNIVWVMGVLYMFVAFVAIWMSANPNEFVKAMVEKNENVSLKAYKSKWYSIPLFAFFGLMALFTIGSGFWFTGFMWLAALITLNIAKVAVRKSAGFQEWAAANK